MVRRFMPIVVLSLLLSAFFIVKPVFAATLWRFTGTRTTTVTQSGFANANACATYMSSNSLTGQCAYDTSSSSYRFTGTRTTSASQDGFASMAACTTYMSANSLSGTCASYSTTGTTGTCQGYSFKVSGSCRQSCIASSEKADGNCTSDSGAAYVGFRCCIASSAGQTSGTCTGTSGRSGTCYSVGNCPNSTAADGSCDSGDSCCTASTTDTTDTAGTAGASANTASVSFTNPLEFETVQGATGVFLNAFQGIIVMLALIFLVLGGIFYITSGGDSKKIETAKSMITAAMIGLAIGVAAPSFLKEIGNVLGWGGSEVPSEVSGARSATEVAQSVLDFLLSIVGLLAMIMLVIGGLMYFAAAGDEKRADTAKGIVKYSIMGIALAIVSLIIVRTIAGLF
ncbi:MAG: hypothetical protein HGB34_03940 [Candidatus Moranbacteria bacterium]|nr:hypothetical protein [Candidatus Moranbacteria bacterium]